MRTIIQHVDKLLRGEYTRADDLRAGGIPVRARTLAGVAGVLGLIYGVFMGLYGILRPESPDAMQLFATTAKVPLLFLLTLVVTYPSLYVFSALARSPLRMHDTLRMLLVAVAVNLALLASFGPVTGFFTLSTDSYPFMIILNVAFFGISGVVGLRFLSSALNTVFSRPLPPVRRSRVVATDDDGGDGDASEPDDVPPPLPADSEPRRAGSVFAVWTIIYGLVGAQMGWILRPFIGSPHQEFTLFRERQSNFFEAFFKTLGNLFE